MGQGQSTPPSLQRSHEELVKELANRFAQKCFTSLELYSLKDNFKSLADATVESPHITRDSSHPEDGENGAESGKSGNNTDNTVSSNGSGTSNKTTEEHSRKPHVLRYLKEDTVARFLAIPDILGVSPVVFQTVSYLGAFPFLSDAPAVLGLEQLVIVVTLLTDRYKRVLAHGASDRRTLLFRSLAVHDRKLFSEDRKEAAAAARAQSTVPTGNEGFAVDASIDDNDGEEDVVKGSPADENDGYDDDLPNDDNDELALAAFDALDYINSSVPTGPKASARKAADIAATLHGARIPADNFRRLLMLLILVAPLGPQEPISLYAGRFTGDALESLRETAQCILATFLDVETSPGIKFAHFDAIVPVCFPFLFSGFNALFEHFLFSKNLDLSRTKPGAGASASDANTDSTTATTTTTSPPTLARRKSSAATIAATNIPIPPLLIQDSANKIMNLNILSQLSFFLPGSSLFHRMRPLYSGDNDGFSMGSFESKVFNWRAPTILLVKGTRISDTPRGPEATFASALPPRRFPHGNGKRVDDGGGDDGDDETLIFGAYVSQPWRLTHRDCFGDSDTVLFQLSPVHDVFGASTINRDYVAFVKPTVANNHAGGIGFGCPSPTGAAVKASLRQHQHVQSAVEGILPLGPLSLMIDGNFEFGAMTHDRGHGAKAHSGGAGGAFHPSAARMFSFQDRFSIEALEVWGCGGDDEAKEQAERWAWEAREAEARRRINLGTGDVDADRALLEMAGLVGANRSGGSMV
ncbi:hypothetical protein HMPREF1624_05272 [Sporothrix schenckii ATCC 58251]|uniref:Restriction of telomere capping protein 5 n=1 Tax=Sporothrix schenckii (strain ATCC 58251 / de Perez 2211183) TaxID=1391915 RepID=U7PS82_SPOS1|nr:hypothetical protein HMPREF1624_05272 [Sporothrix schenckii ATCC 58251]